MHRERFTKKTQKPTGILYECSEDEDAFPKLASLPPPNNLKKLPFATVTPQPQLLFTPQKDALLEEEGDSKLQLSNFSEFDHSLFEKCSSPRHNRTDSRLTVAHDISHFIDSQSSEKSDLSFRSDIGRVERRTTFDPSKVSRTTFQSCAPSLQQPPKSFINNGKFKQQFQKPIQEMLESRFHVLNFKESWGLEKLFHILRAARINHPFKEPEGVPDTKLNETLPSVMDKWIHEYGKNQKLIFSFDFMFSHVSLIMVLIFYWLQLEDEPKDQNSSSSSPTEYNHINNDSVGISKYERASSNWANPMLSPAENAYTERLKGAARKNVLSILFEYIWHRSRELRNNLIAIKILNEFYDYLKSYYLHSHKVDSKVEELIVESHQILSERLKYESHIKDKLEDGKDCDPSHLRQIFKNYEERDKFIRDNVEDIADIFFEIDKRAFANSPLSRFYQTGEEDLNKKSVAENYTILTCWFLSLVLKKCRTNGYVAIEYVARFFELTRLFFRRHNLQSFIFFATVLLNIKQFVNTLWLRFLDRKHPMADEEITNMILISQNTPFVIPPVQKEGAKEVYIIFESLRIYKIMETIKQKVKKDSGNSYLVNMSWHYDIQEFARKILHFRKIIENELVERESAAINRTIKVNLNYRFLYYEVYKILAEEGMTPNQRFQQFKDQAAVVDGNIYFPFFNFNGFG